MHTQIYRVLTTQFLTAFADNAVLFTAITMVMNKMQVGSWYIPALQAAFLVAFVVFAPWVGRFADSRAKPNVLFIANIVKALGVVFLFLEIDPLIAYGFVGFGAAIYSPAKYGILPELVSEADLVKANGWIEGSTILAILSGTVVGAMLSEYSISLALLIIAILYLLSAVFAKTIQHDLVIGSSRENSIKVFKSQIRGLLATPRARFSTVGVSLFWAAATVLRVLIIAWAPVVLFIHSTTEISLLTLYVAIGIAVGSFLVPKLIPMAYLRRARLAAYAMGVVIIMLSFVDNMWIARITLFFAGVCGGLFVVPINAALQEIGFKSIGSGGAVAIQNFFENVAMLVGSAIYAVVAMMGINPATTMMGLGLSVVVLTIIVSWHLPKDTGRLN